MTERAAVERKGGGASLEEAKEGTGHPAVESSEHQSASSGVHSEAAILTLSLSSSSAAGLDLFIAPRPLPWRSRTGEQQQEEEIVDV